MQLRDRGFTLVDIGMVPKHHVDFGSEWMPRWKYESILPGLIRRKVSVDEAHPCKPVPVSIRFGMPWLKLLRRVRGAGS